MNPFSALLLLHLAASSVWFGAALLTPADVRESLSQGGSEVSRLLTRLRRTAKLMNLAAYSTVATGVGLIAMAPSWRGTRLSIWWGLGLTLLAIAVGRLMIRPAVVAIVGSVNTGLSPEEARGLSARFARGVHLENALRLAVLVLMVFR